MTSVGRLAAFIAALGAVLSLAPERAEAKGYAAMKEEPVRSGELRLATPRDTGSGAEAVGFPLKHTRVDIQVHGAVASGTVEQTFTNPFDEALEALYLFPLGADAAVHAYEIVVGDRTVKGSIATREKARKTYEEARSAGRTTGLMAEEKANIFQQSVANIPPRQTVVVRFRYVELLAPKDGAYELVYPMVVGPRYLPVNTSEERPIGAHRAGSAPRAGVTSIPYLPPSQRSGHDIEVTVRVDAAVPLESVTSPSHCISTRKLDETSTEVTLDAEERIPNRDFVLRYSAAGPATQLGVLTHRDERGGYLTLVVQPKAEYRAQDIAPREVVLVIDRSCSMYGEPMAQAKAVSRELLAGLTPRDTFNLVTFASGVTTLSQQAIPADAAGRARAEAWLEALSANGGTEMVSGLARSLSREPGDDRLRMVYVMTDGFVGNDDEVIRLARDTQRFNRVFPIGIGSAPNRYLLDRMGEVARGFTTYVLRQDDVTEVIHALVTRTTQPYLTDIQIDWGRLPVQDATPAVIPDVYAGLPLVVAARYDRAAKGTVRVTANAGGKRITTELAIELPAAEQRPAIAQLWARRRIHELELQNDADAKKRDIEALGLRFGLVTRYTSFVAVDERQVTDGRKTRTVVQPVEAPEGVNFAAAVPEAADIPSSPSGSTWTLGRGGGGDVDPFTLVTLGSFLPLAWALRKRRRAQASSREGRA